MIDKLLIFDFDGTIVDSKAVYYSAIEHELMALGFPRRSVDKTIDLGLSLRKTLSALRLNFITNLILKRRIMNQVKEYTTKIKKCKDVDSIKNIDEKKILVTNSLKEFAIPILKHLKLKKAFSAIYGADDFSDKEKFIKDYLQKNHIDKKDCFYIGDRAADVKLAKKIGCMSVIVSGRCAWNSRKEIMNANPDFLINDLKNLKETLVKQGQPARRTS